VQSGPHVPHDVGFDGGNRAVPPSSHRGLNHLLARVYRREERLEAVLDPADRPPGRTRRQCDRDLLRVEVEFGAEAATDAGHDHPDSMFRQAEHLREQVAHDVYDLRGGPERQFVRVRVPVGKDTAGFERAAELPLDAKALGDDKVGFPEPRVDVPHLRLECRRDVVGPVVVQERRVIAERALDIADRGQNLPVDVDLLTRVFSDVLGFADNDGNRLARVAYALARERVVRRLALPGEQVRTRLRRQVGRQVGGGEHRVHAGKRTRALDIDAADSRMRERASQERRMEHAGPHDVRDVATPAGQ
jgi:hypothetical protein